METYKNELSKALGFLYWLSITIDGEVATDEINILESLSFFNEYTEINDLNGNSFEVNKEIPDRLKSAVEILNLHLNKTELQNFFYEINKLILTDNKMERGEVLIVKLISEYISLTRGEIKEVLKNLRIENDSRL